MKTKILILLLVASVMTPAFAQEENDDIKLDRLWKLDSKILGIGLSLDLPLSSSFLLETALELGSSYAIEDNDNNWEPCLRLSLTGDWYYDRAKRQAKNKSLKYNSGNFIGVSVSQSSQSLIDGNYSPLLSSSIHWGISRDIDERWLIRFNIGLGCAYNWDLDKWEFMIPFNFKFSYIFPW